MITARRTAIASAYLIGARLLGRVIDFGTLLILARLLGPSDFGLIAIAMSLILIMEAVLELPVGQVLLVEESLESGMLDTAFTISLLRGLILAILLVSCAWPFAYVYQDQRLFLLIVILAIAPAVRGIQNPSMILFDRNLDFKRQIAGDMLSKMVSSGVAVLVAHKTGSYWSLVIASVLTPVTLIIVSFILAPYRPRLTLVRWRSFIKFLGWISAGQMLSAVAWQLDRLVLGRVVDKPTVGRFMIADQLAGLPSQIFLVPLTGPLAVSLSAARVDNQRLRMAYLKLVNAVAAVGLPSLVGLALVAKSFVNIALGPSWSDTGQILMWLALASIPSLVWLPFNSLAISLRRTDLIFSRQLLDFVVKIPILISLVVVYGVLGACLARGIAATILGAASLLTTRKIISVSITEQFAAISRPMIGSIVMAMAIFWPVYLCPLELPTVYAVGYLVAIIIFGVLIYVLTLGLLWRAANFPPGCEKIVFDLFRKLMESRIYNNLTPR